MPRSTGSAPSSPLFHPALRPFLPPTVWPLLQLHATRVAFLAFAALADVDTTVAPSPRRQLDTDRARAGETDADTETETEMAMEMKAARRWPNEKSQRRARNCSACPITMRQVFLLCGKGERDKWGRVGPDCAWECGKVIFIHSFIQFGVATHFYVSFLCAKCECECECCLFFSCCHCHRCCCFILLLFFWTCLVFLYFILLFFFC